MRLVGLTGIAACLAMAGCAPYPYGYYAVRRPYGATPGVITPGVPPEPVTASQLAADPYGANYGQPSLAGVQPAYPQGGYPVPAQGYYRYAPRSYYAYAPQSYYGYAPQGYYGYASPPYVAGPSARDEDHERHERERVERDRLNREQADRDRFTQERTDRDRLTQERAERDRLNQEQQRDLFRTRERERFNQEQQSRNLIQARERAERDRLNQEQRDRDLIRERVLRPATQEPARPSEGPARVQDFRQAPPSAPPRPPLPRPGLTPDELRRPS